LGRSNQIGWRILWEVITFYTVIQKSPYMGRRFKRLHKW